MEHKKAFYQINWPTHAGDLVIEGPIPTRTLLDLSFHEGLKAFRSPKRQRQALIEISKLPESRIIIARTLNEIVGYATFLYPDPMERWAEIFIENLLELGAIEVAAPFRNAGVSKAILNVAFMDNNLEDYIVITTEYYWHWDLKGTGLSIWEYRRLMEKMMGSAGLQWYATDDPEICSHPANCLMARIGKRVKQETIETFDQLRFHNRYI